MTRTSSTYGLFVVLALLGAVCIALAFFVQRNTTSISDALTAEVLQQQSDVAVLLHDYDRLIFALASEKNNEQKGAGVEIIAALIEAEQALEQMRFNYSFERLDGASTAHASVKPVLEDVRQWLIDGIPGVTLGKTQLITLATNRLVERQESLRFIAAETYTVANDLLNTQAGYLNRFGQSLIFLLAAFALLAGGIASLLTRQKDLQIQLAEDQRQHVQRINDFADAGADWFWELNRDLQLRWLSGQTLTAPSRYDNQGTSAQSDDSLPAYSHRIENQDWPFEALHRQVRFDDYEAHWVTRDGQRKIVAVSGLPLFDIGGRFSGYRGIGRDITAKKEIERNLEAANKGLLNAESKGRQQAEQALRDSEIFLRTSLNALPQRLAILDEEGIILETNTSWRQYAQGDESREFLPEGGGTGWHYQEVFTTKAEAERNAFEGVSELIDAVLDGRSDSLHTEVSIFNGAETDWLSVALAPFQSNGKRFFVLAIEEVTDRKRLEERDRQLRADLAHFSRLTTVGELATGLAHELNQPLTAISHNCDALLSGIQTGAPLDSHDIEAIHAIHSEAERAGAIIKGLRKMVRKETGGTAETDINQLVTDTMRLGIADAKRYGIEVTLNLANELPRVKIDAVQIQQVLVNLERNAVEAIKASDSPERQLIITTAYKHSGCVQVTIQDTGDGISEEMKPALFSPFVTTKIGGMGMGLSISRSIVESHRGQLWADFSLPGLTTFHFSLPVDLTVDSTNS